MNTLVGTYQFLYVKQISNNVQSTRYDVRKVFKGMISNSQLGTLS